MFQNNGDHVTISLNIPFAVGTLSAVAVAVGFALFLVALLYAVNHGRDLLGKLKRWHDKPVFNAVIWFSFLLFPVWLALLALTLTGTFELWFNPPETGSGSSENMLAYRVHFLALVGLMTALAGLIGAPLALIRVFSTERQVKATEEGLLTDRINKAVEGLGAEKTVKQAHETPQYRKDEEGEWIRDANGDPVPALRPDGQPIVDRQVVEQSVPNLEVRIGAIYALERIARLNLSEHIQIMEILTAYIRENAPAKDALEFPEAPEWFEGKNEKGERWSELNHTWSIMHHEALSNVKPRADIQAALVVIGRRTEKQKRFEHGDWKFADQFDPATQSVLATEAGKFDSVRMLPGIERNQKDAQLHSQKAYRLDLRATDLTGADMRHSDFTNALFDDAKLRGVNLSDSTLHWADFERADLRGANFENARMQGGGLKDARFAGANLYGAQLQRANLVRAQLQGQQLPEAQLQEALLIAAKLQEIELENANLQGADLSGAWLQRANLPSSNLQGAHFSHAQLQDANLGEAQLQWARFNYAQLDGASLWSAQMQYADFFAAALQGAELFDIEIDEHTDLAGSNLRMAAFKAVNLIGKNSRRIPFARTFGDASAILPDGFSRPGHWPDFDMDYEEFQEEWRKWKADPDAYVPPQAPDAD